MDALMGLDPEVRDTIIELQQENMDLSASLATKTDELEACRAQLLRTQTERDALRDQVTTVRLEARDQLNAVRTLAIVYYNVYALCSGRFVVVELLFLTPEQQYVYVVRL